MRGCYFLEKLRNLQAVVHASAFRMYYAGHWRQWIPPGQLIARWQFFIAMLKPTLFSTKNRFRNFIPFTPSSKMLLSMFFNCSWKPVQDVSHIWHTPYWIGLISAAVNFLVYSSLLYRVNYSTSCSGSRTFWGSVNYTLMRSSDLHPFNDLFTTSELPSDSHRRQWSIPCWWITHRKYEN